MGPGAVQRGVDLGVVVLGLLIALGGLAWCVRAATPDPVVVQRAGGTVAMIAASEVEEVQLALLDGTLTTTSSGCLAVAGSDGGLTALQLPAGSTLLSDGQGVAVPGHGVVLLGERISGGGGFADADAGVDAPEECLAGLDLFVWQD